MMTLDEILQDIHALEADLTTYERKYGVLSEVFYESYANGEEPSDENWVLDWTRWASAYQIWLRRHEQYRQAIKSLQFTATLSEIIEKRAQYDPLPISAWLRKLCLSYPYYNPTLASTHPHHKHIPPDMQHHRIPAPGLSFTQPNLSFLIGEMESLLSK